MAESNEQVQQTTEDVEDHEEEGQGEGPQYKKPAMKPLDEIIKTDEEDESLRKYKQQLLGVAGAGEKIKPFPNDPRRVIVTELALVVDGRPDVTMDLTGDLKKLKEKPFVIKEGAPYKMRVTFYVQEEIISGLKYVQKSYRKGIRVDKSVGMVGSYGPRMEPHTWLTQLEDAPKGMMARGDYKVESLFTDDDDNEHLKWEWKIQIAKEWS